MRELVTQLSCHLQAQACFPHSTWTRQGQQAHFWAAQQLTDSCDFLLAPYQGSRLDRQIVGMRVKRLERREINREIRDVELKEVAGPL